MENNWRVVLFRKCRLNILNMTLNVGFIWWHVPSLSFSSLAVLMLRMWSWMGSDFWRGEITRQGELAPSCINHLYSEGSIISTLLFQRHCTLYVGDRDLMNVFFCGVVDELWKTRQVLSNKNVKTTTFFSVLLQGEIHLRFRWHYKDIHILPPFIYMCTPISKSHQDLHNSVIKTIWHVFETLIINLWQREDIAYFLVWN